MSDEFEMAHITARCASCGLEFDITMSGLSCPQCFTHNHFEWVRKELGLQQCDCIINDSPCNASAKFNRNGYRYCEEHYNLFGYTDGILQDTPKEVEAFMCAKTIAEPDILTPTDHEWLKAQKISWTGDDREK